MILVLSDLWVPFPGGAERLMFNLARDLMRRGEDVRVLTGYHAAQQFDGPPFDVIEVPENMSGSANLVQAIEAAEPDVILTHHYWALHFEYAIVCRDVPVVQIVLNGRRLPGADHAVFISEFVRDRPGMLSDPDDQVIYPLAFDDVRADTHGDAIGFIKPLPHKGVDLFYAIACAMPDRQFVCLRGEWQDIETIVELPNVEFMEPVDDIRDFYARCRMVLVPSLSEDAGTVAQECAVNDVPCISSNVGGLRETNHWGIRIYGDAVEDWVDAITGLDVPLRYHTQVQRQRGNPTSQPEALDRFAAAVKALQP